MHTKQFMPSGYFGRMIHWYRSFFLAFWAFLFLIGCLSLRAPQRWGFFGHRLINRQAVFSLPPEMISFYKKNIATLEAMATLPDQRRYVVEGEAPRHYIDLDVYGDSAAWKLPRYWQAAVDSLGEKTLLSYGIVPWHIERMQYRLTDAFRRHDRERVLRYSAELGHYIADAHVPLHTTENYNGQLSGQYGIHGFWESRLPELFAEGYDFWVGKASYLPETQAAAWEAVQGSHAALDSVLRFEKLLSEEFPGSQQHSFEERNGKTIEVYSREYATAYHEALDGMVERRMQAAIRMVADFWLTCWVNAGQPDLSDWELMEIPFDSTLLQTPDTLQGLSGHQD